MIHRKKQLNRNSSFSTLQRRLNPENFEIKSGFYYRTSNQESDFPVGPSLIYIGLDTSIYSIDLKSYRFFKNIDGKNKRLIEKFIQLANDPYWELFIEPIKNDKLLRMLTVLRENNKIL